MPDRQRLTLTDTLLWQVFAIVGMLFFVLGVVNLGLVWFPLELGEPEWEYGTTSAFFDLFPLLGLGIALLVSSSIALGWKWTARGVALTCILVAVFMWLAFALFVTVFPLVFRAVGSPVALTPVKKAAAKTAVQALIYPFALLWLAGAAWRATLRRRGG